MPTTPPVRNAIRMAGRSPASLAAAATRTLPRTASDMPRNPTRAENTAPTRKNRLRPQRTDSPSAGRSSSTKKIRTTKTPIVLNCRLQVRRRALLDRLRDLPHLGRALAGRQYFPDQQAGHDEGEQRDHAHDDNPGEVGAGHADWPARKSGVRHLSSLTGHAPRAMQTARCCFPWAAAQRTVFQPGVGSYNVVEECHHDSAGSLRIWVTEW